MKRLLFFCTLLISGFAYSQTMPRRQDLQSINAKGYEWLTGSFKNGIYLPQDTLQSADSAAVAIKNSVLYIKNVRRGDSLFWGPISASGGSSSFLAGNTTPDNSVGTNGNYYLQQNKSQLFKKSAGSWGAIGYIRADTIVPIVPRDTLYTDGTVYNLGAAWDARALPFTEGAFFKNPNAIGNTALQFRDDAVRFDGWNINGLGLRRRPLEAANYHQWESHFDTRQFGDSAFEHHKVHLFVPGSPGATLFPEGIRVWSENTSKALEWSQIYYTVNEMKWKWRKAPGAPIYDWMTAYPGGLELTMPIKMDSIPTNGGAFFVLNGKTLWETNTTGSVSRGVLTHNTGLKDTTFLINDAGSFIFNNLTSTGFSVFYGNGIVLGSPSTSYWGVNSNGDMQLNSQAGFSSSMNVNFHNSVYGITLNKETDRRAYLDISSDPVTATSYNNYFRFNCTDPDSVINPVALNFEKLRGLSMSSSALVGTRGMELNLNSVLRYGTEFQNFTGSNGNYVADHTWSTTPSSGSLTERMRLKYNGNFLINTTSDNGGKLQVNGGSQQYSIHSTTTTGSAVYGYTSSSGNALYADAGADTLSKGIFVNYVTSQTNAGGRSYPAISIFRSGSSANHGQGAGIEWTGINYIEGGMPGTPLIRQYGLINLKRQNLDGPDASSQMEFSTMQDSAFKKALVLDEGNVILSQYDGTYTGTAAYDLSIETGGKIIVTPSRLRGSTTWQPGTVAAGSSVTTTISVTGAALGDPVVISKASGAYSNGEVYDAFVSATNTVTIRVHNVSTGSANYNTTETYKVIVHKY